LLVAENKALLEQGVDMSLLLLRQHKIKKGPRRILALRREQWVPEVSWCTSRKTQSKRIRKLTMKRSWWRAITNTEECPAGNVPMMPYGLVTTSTSTSAVFTSMEGQLGWGLRPQGYWLCEWCSFWW